MSVILVIISLVYAAFSFQPSWFEDTPYHHVSTHETLKDCEEAKFIHVKLSLLVQDGVCYGDSPSKLYVKDGEEVGMPYPPVEPYFPDSPTTEVKTKVETEVEKEIDGSNLDDVGADSIYS